MGVPRDCVGYAGGVPSTIIPIIGNSAVGMTTLTGHTNDPQGAVLLTERNRNRGTVLVPGPKGEAAC